MIWYHRYMFPANLPLAYRNLDFVLERESIRFPALRIPHYVTNMQRMPDPPNGNGPTPELLDVKQIDQETTLKFRDLDGMRASSNT